MTSNTSDKCYVYFEKLPSTPFEKLQYEINMSQEGDTVTMS